MALIKFLSAQANLDLHKCFKTFQLLISFGLLITYVVLFELILYVPVNNFSCQDRSSRVEPVLNSDSAGCETRTSNPSIPSLTLYQLSVFIAIRKISTFFRWNKAL